MKLRAIKQFVLRDTIYRVGDIVNVGEDEGRELLNRSVCSDLESPKSEPVIVEETVKKKAQTTSKKKKKL